MSYQINVILTDGRTVRGVFGSNDFSYLELFDEQEFYEHDEHLEGYFDRSTGELSSKKLMENIIRGNTDKLYSHLLLDKKREKFAKSALAAVYGYLQRDLCYHFGKGINRNEDGTSMLPAYLEEFEPRNRSFFKIPYSLDFPHIFCVLYEEMEEYKQLYSEKLKVRYPDDDELQKDVDYIFSQMKETGLDLFLCNY